MKTVGLLILFICFPIQAAYKGTGLSYKLATKNAIENFLLEKINILYGSSSKKNQNIMLARQLYLLSDNFLKYSILPGSKSEAFGLYKIEISGEVDYKILAHELLELKIFPKAITKPSVMVMVENQNSTQKPSFDYSTNSVIEKILLQRGFQVIDNAKFKDWKNRNKSLAESIDAAAAYGNAYGADLVITGTTNVDSPISAESYGVKTYNSSCHINIKLIKTDIASIVYSDAISLMGGALSMEGAIQDSRKKSSELISTKLAEQLESQWYKSLFENQKIDLIISNVEEPTLTEIDSKFNYLENIISANLRYFEKNITIFTIDYRGQLKELRKQLTSKLGLKITGISRHQITSLISESSQQTISSNQDKQINTSPLRIVEIVSSEIFASRQGSYNDTPIGEIELESIGDFPIKNILIETYVTNYSSGKTETMFSLINPGYSKSIPFYINIDAKKVQKVFENQETQLKISIKYEYDGKRFQRNIQRPITICQKNAIFWDEPYSIGNFITQNNPDIKNLATKAARISQTLPQNNFYLPLAHSLALFHSLRDMGLQYIKDQSPFVYKNKILDHVQYPSETLKRKMGDCDDLTVLFASVLESLGVSTGLAIFKNHVLLLINSEINTSQTVLFGSYEPLVFPNQGTYWFPIEVTDLQNGNFFQAMEKGAQLIQQTLKSGNSFNWIRTTEAMSQFPPVQYSESTSSVEITSRTNLSADSKTQWAKFLHEVEGYYKSNKIINKNLDQAEIYGHLAHYYFLTDRLDSTKKYVRQSWHTDSSKASVINNMGNFMFLTHNYSKAVKLYQSALSKRKNSPKISINYGLSLMKMGDTENGFTYIKSGITMLNLSGELIGYRQIQNFLGILGEDKKNSQADSLENIRIQNQLDSLVREVLKESVPNAPVKTKKGVMLALGGIKGTMASNTTLSKLLWWM